jgi:polyketide synthase PksM
LWTTPRAETASYEELIDTQRHGVLHGFRLIKALLACGYGSRALAWTVVTCDTQSVRKATAAPAHAGIHGLVGAWAKEYPHWTVRLLDLGRDADWHSSAWQGLPPDPHAWPYAYRDGQWYRAQLIVARAATEGHSPYRHEGVYVAIGGAGHIGAAWTEWVARNCRAKVVWLGRRAKDEAIEERIRRIAAIGPAPEYIAADAADRESLRRAYSEIKRAHGRVDGLILSSHVFEPCSLEEMDEGRFATGLRAKVDVAVRALEVFGQEPLDFVVFFSSLVSFIKNPLQSHYAAACAFADAFACHLSSRFGSAGGPAVKVMNWGYWDGAEGARAEELARAGVGFIEQREAMPALESLMNGPIHQVGLLKTTKPLLIEGISHRTALIIYPNKPTISMRSLESRMRARGQSDARR